MQRLFADPAFVREEEVEKTANCPSHGVPHAIGHHAVVLAADLLAYAASETGEQATREDPPPPKTSFYNIACYTRFTEHFSATL